MVDTIGRHELQGLIESDEIQVVDVLPEDEFRRGHIPGAINVPLKTLDRETVRVLNRGKPVAVY